MELPQPLQNVINSLTGNEDSTDPPAPENIDEGADADAENEDDLEPEPEPEEDDDYELTVEDLEYEINELTDEVESLQSSIRTLSTDQDEMKEDMSDMSDRVRKLLGVYGKLTKGHNPLKKDDGDSTFNLTGSTKTDDSDENNDTENDEKTDDTEDTSDEDTISFDDLRQNTEPDTEETEEDDEDDTDDEEEDAVARTPDTFLTTPPDSFASEMIAFEWLTELVDTAGTAGALKAIVYYEDIDWISPEIRAYLETMVSGPGVETGTPAQRPEELSTDHHKQSYRYIMKLSAISGERD